MWLCRRIPEEGNFEQRVSFAWAGVASPIVLATATFVVAGQRPEYSHSRQILSELGTVGRTGAMVQRSAKAQV